VQKHCIHTQQANEQTEKHNFWLLYQQLPHGCTWTSFTERKAVIGRYLFVCNTTFAYS